MIQFPMFPHLLIEMGGLEPINAMVVSESVGEQADRLAGILERYQDGDGDSPMIADHCGSGQQHMESQ